MSISPGRARPRMADVARLAGVSHQTVSRVINDVPGIRPETRLRVEKAIKELGYRRNAAARMLASSRSKLVGVLVYGAEQYGPANMVLGLQGAAEATPYDLAIAAVNELSISAFRTAAKRLLEADAEALIVIAPHRSMQHWLNSLEVGIPIVVVEGDLSSAPLNAGLRQVEGARMATRHLLDAGHETVFHLAGPLDWLDAMARRDGWQAELEAAGREVPPLRWSGDWSARSGYETGRSLAREREITAVFAANDQMALGFIHALHEIGRRVPEDVSLVGFDDIPEAAYFTPPLTTVHQDFPELGRRAMALVEAVMEGNESATVPLVDPRLIVRASTATPE